MTTSYSLSYAVAWAVAIVGVIAGVLAGTGLVVHPSWLSNDVAATAAVVSTICVGLAAILPQIGRTPGNREASYLKAAVAGVLPKDIAEKHPLVKLEKPGAQAGVPPAG